MTVPKVAVLLPTFNSAKFILAQLGSIVGQENVDVDVYIYDDGSYDETLNLVKSTFCGSNIFFVNEGGPFGSASLSFLHLIRTVDLKRYDYISLADHDDIWSCFKISSAINEIIKTDSDAFSSSVLSMNIDENGYTHPYLVAKHASQRKYDYLFEGPGPGCTFVLTKKFMMCFKTFLEATPEPLDHLRWHDWFIYYFARMNNFTWVISRHPNMLYFQWGSNDTGVNKGMSAFIKRFSWVFSGWYFEQSRFMYNTILKSSDCAEDPVDFASYKFWILNGLSLRRSSIESALFCLVAIVNVFKSKLR
ncbi:MAG: glycosyltransferase [Bacteroidetes bacterium]|nr:glycosyltransferase [Bacteroidota bacterium]